VTELTGAEVRALVEVVAASVTTKAVVKELAAASVVLRELPGKE
jgi:hypothetical protein